jgi:hypothetical protein
VGRSKPAIRIRSRNIPTPKLIRWLTLDLGEKVTSIALMQVEIMLLEFTVENYRSIKEPVTLSAVAQKAPKRKSSAKTKRGVKSDAENLSWVSGGRLGYGVTAG